MERRGTKTSVNSSCVDSVVFVVCCFFSNNPVVFDIICYSMFVFGLNRYFCLSFDFIVLPYAFGLHSVTLARR